MVLPEGRKMELSRSLPGIDSAMSVVVLSCSIGYSTAMLVFRISKILLWSC
jgi:hypothetical protein